MNLKTDIFMNRFEPIHFKTTIPIIYVNDIFFENYISLINSKNDIELKYLFEKYIEYKKIHSIKSSKDTNLIIKVIYYIDGKFYEMFMIFNNFKSKEKIDDYVINTFLKNKYIIDINDDKIIKTSKNHCMSIVYKYNYIKKTNGDKQLTPIKTILNEKLRPKIIMSLGMKYYKECEYNLYVLYYLKYKKKKTKYDKQLKALFKIYKKDNYLNYLCNDIKLYIVNYL